MAGIVCLQPYKNYISITFSIMSILLNLSPIINFVNVCKGNEKYTNIPPLMLLFSFLNNAIWGGIGVEKTNFLLFYVVLYVAYLPQYISHGIFILFLIKVSENLFFMFFAKLQLKLELFSYFILI